jgi:dihydropyrimidine dehydrogenase (NAD+) subunit PreA
MAEVKKRYPKNAVIASLMVASTREAWHEIVRALKTRARMDWS